MVVEDVDCEEEGDVYKPSFEWDAHRLKKQSRWSCRKGKMIRIPDRRDEEKLEEGEECSCDVN